MDTLIEQARRGDEAAFETIVRNTRLEVASCIAARLHDRGLAEEVLVETYSTAFESLDRYRLGSDNVAAWLKGIARNLCRREIRLLMKQRGRQQGLPMDLAQEEERECASLAEEQRLVYLAQCLEALPPTGQQLLQARYREGEDVSRLAMRFHRPRESISRLLSKWRRKLMDCIRTQEARA